MNHASCLCGSIEWQVDGPLSQLMHCHCTMCRKAHGSAFATYAVVPRAAFSWLGGEASVRAYESSPGFHRPFCGHCGSALPQRYGDDRLFIPVGCLDGRIDDLPEAHIFVADRAPWYRISDELAQYDAYPPGVEALPVSRPASQTAAQAGCAGSCLCGGVAFELRGPMTAAYHCHCRRCRKARAAAHASNARAAQHDLVFIRGSQQLLEFKLPGAKYFTQVFCRTCGSAMPRIDPQREMASIPLGSLDSRPPRAPDHHIFVGSKATWFPIADDLPQFAERQG